MFSGKVGVDDGLTPEQLMETFNTGNGFTSGVGVEYPENILVEHNTGSSESAVSGDDYLSGILRPGRRLLNVRMKRFADGWQRDLHDDLKSTGRFRILCLTSTDLLDPESISVKALWSLASMMPLFPPSLVEQIVVHPPLSREFEWEDLPSCVKQYSEMSFYNGFVLEDVYTIYGVDPSKGALVVRPDGYVGLVSTLTDVVRVEEFFRRFINMV